MEHRHDGRRILARLDRGEDVVEALTALCLEHGVGAGTLTAIGAVEAAELGYYDLPARAYETRVVDETCELLSLSGNVALVDGALFIHAHVVLGRRDLTTLGGHLVRARVAVTVEALLDPLEGELERSEEPALGLKLLRP